MWLRGCPDPPAPAEHPQPAASSWVLCYGSFHTCIQRLPYLTTTLPHTFPHKPPAQTKPSGIISHFAFLLLKVPWRELAVDLLIKTCHYWEEQKGRSQLLGRLLPQQWDAWRLLSACGSSSYSTKQRSAVHVVRGVPRNSTNVLVETFPTSLAHFS